MKCTKMVGIVVVAAVAAISAVAPVSSAAILIHTPTNNTTASSFLPTPNFRGPTQTRDGSGLSGAVPSTINSVADLPKHNEAPEAPQGGMWLTTGSTTSAWIIFDMGTPVTFDQLYVWNYAEVAQANNPVPLDLTERGAKNVAVYADNNPTPTTLIQSFVFNKANPTPVGSMNVGGAGAWNLDYSTAADNYSLNAPVMARYIMFNISSTYGANNGQYIGLSEVRFGETVPEPASMSLFMMGMGLTLAGRKLRRSAI